MAEVVLMLKNLKADPLPATLGHADIFRLALLQAKTDILKAKKDRLSRFRDIREHMEICQAADEFLKTLPQGGSVRTLVNQKWTDLVAWSRQVEEAVEAGQERVAAVPGFFVGTKLPSRDEIQALLDGVPELRERMVGENRRLLAAVPEGVLAEGGKLDPHFESYLLFTERSSAVAVPRVTEQLRAISTENAANPILATVDRYESSLRGLLEKHAAQKAALEAAARHHREGNHLQAAACLAPIGTRFPDLDYQVLEEVRELEATLQKLERLDGGELAASAAAFAEGRPGLAPDSELGLRLARLRERGLKKQSRSRVIIATLSVAALVALGMGIFAGIGLAEKSQREEQERLARQAAETERLRAAEAEAEARRAQMLEESRLAGLRTAAENAGSPAGSPDAETAGFIAKNQGSELRVSTGPSGPEMALRWIPAGSFIMGGSPDDPDARLTPVTLAKGFWLGRTEVTQAQWSALMDSNPSERAGADLPVEQVHWGEAMGFCRTLTERERRAGRLPKGLVYTLPTEAQWEYACRAGQEGEGPTGSAQSAWSMDNSGGRTNPVASLAPNAWGLHDMFGNVAEWCRDWYGPLPGTSVSDPAGPTEGRRRVNRGGGWLATPADFRFSRREKDVPEIRSRTLGFRVALVRP